MLVLVGLGTYLLWPGDGEQPAGTAAQPEQSDGPSGKPSASDEPSTDPSESATEEPSSEPSSEPSAPAGGTRAEVRAFVANYFSLVTSDPRQSYVMLTPEFQAASGGYERYSGFWSTISSARPHDIEVDPETLTTSYTIDYVKTSGATTTQQVQLQLVKQGDGYLIAGEG